MLLKKTIVILNTIKNNRFYTTKMSSPILYYDDVSPPARFVLMTAHYLGVKLNLHKVDLFKNENRSTFYKTINPLYKVPAMFINNHTIRDSHAIAIYLCGMSNGSLGIYPEQPLERAKVHEMLFYNSSTLFPIDSTIFTNYFAGKTDIDDNLKSSWSTALHYLDNKLNETSWLSGNSMTLSDLCCAATVSSVELLIPVKENTPQVISWLQQIKKQPFYEVNSKGLNRLSQFIQRMK